MSLVKHDEMTILRPASASASTAETAEDDIQLASVAYLINQAANTGSYEAVFQDTLRPNVKAQLESNGYTIKFINNNAYNMEHHSLIIWREPKVGDAFPEPSNSGLKYNARPDALSDDEGE